MHLGTYLYWLTTTFIVGFWMMDILNMPFMETFDTAYPLNGLFWTLAIVWLAGSPSISSLIQSKNEKKKD